MTPELLIHVLLIAAIAAGPEDFVAPAAFGLLAVLGGTLLYGLPSIDLVGLTFVGILVFGARALLRVLTGYGALIRSPATNRTRETTARDYPETFDDYE